MRKFVAALFGCCAPSRTPSQCSSLDGGKARDPPADPRDIDEGSILSSYESFGALLYGASVAAPSSSCSRVADHSVCQEGVQSDICHDLDKVGHDDVPCDRNDDVLCEGSDCHSSLLSAATPDVKQSHSSLVISVMSEVSVIEKRFSRDFTNWRLEDGSPTDGNNRFSRDVSNWCFRDESASDDDSSGMEKDVETSSDKVIMCDMANNCTASDHHEQNEVPSTPVDASPVIAASDIDVSHDVSVTEAAVESAGMKDESSPDDCDSNPVADNSSIPTIYVTSLDSASLSSSETSSIGSSSSSGGVHNGELKSNEYRGLMIRPEDDTVLLEGYLYKRSRNTFKTWKRRYFMIKTNQLHCQKRGKGNKNEDHNKVVSEDLRISQVRSTEEQDRRYCFELIMPTKKIYLQADSQEVKDAWIKSLQCGIEAAIHSTLTPDTENVVEVATGFEPESVIKSGNSPEILQLLQDIKDMPGNDVCADCCSNEPVWASINLGVTLCIGCSGIHRNLGVHISKVRSIELDIWETEQCLLMLQLGNKKVNRIYEHKVVEPHKKPQNSEILSENEVWIRAKYEEKLFLENREFINANKRPKSSCSNSLYKGTSISYDPSSLTSGGSSSVKLRAKARENAIRPLSKIFQNMNRKKRGGSDDAAEIDTDHEGDMSDRARYAPLGMEEPNGEGETHSETCVPDNLLSNSTLSNSNPDITINTEDTSDSTLNLNVIGQLALNNSLFEASLAGNLDTMFTLIAEGADVNFRNGSVHDRTPLIQAVHSDSKEAVQLLLINGSDINQLDESRQTALHHATLLGSTDLACLLLRRGADHKRVNSDNKDVLDIAVQEERASLVTVLRYIRLNDITDPTSQQLLNEFSRRSNVQR